MDDQPNSAFVRQRRNLMVVSLVLLFSQISGLKITKLNVFGTEFLIGEPRAVTALLWIATVYWAIRYYQYSREYHGKLGSFVRDYMQRNVEPLVLEQWRHDNPKVDVVPLYDEDGNKRHTLSIYRWFDRFNHIEITCKVDAAGPDMTVRLSGMGLHWFRMRAWTEAIVNTPIATDWIVPYIVLSLPILYAGYKAI